MDFTDEPVLGIASVRIIDIPTVLAMYSHRNPCQPRWKRRFKCRKVPGVDNVRSIFSEQSVERREEFHAVPRRFVQRHKFYIRAHDTGAKRRVTFCQSNNDMPKPFAIEAVDEIDDTILQPAHRKAEDHMDDQESPFLIRRCHCSADRAAAAIWVIKAPPLAC